MGQGRGFGGPIRVRQGPSQRIRISRGPPPAHRAGPQGPHNLGMDQAALENALQDFVFNLAGMQFGGAGAGGAAGGAPGGARFHFIGKADSQCPSLHTVTSSPHHFRSRSSAARQPRGLRLGPGGPGRDYHTAPQPDGRRGATTNGQGEYSANSYS